MTYDARETSAQDGRPVELYDFRRGTKTWRHTTADTEQVVDGQTYERAIIERTSIERGSEITRAGLTLKLQRDHPIAQLYRVAAPSDVIMVTIRQLHQDDGQPIVIWNGRIVSVTPWTDGGRAEMRLETVRTSLRRNGLRRTYQKSCPRVLYSAGCAASASGRATAGPVDSISGLTVVVPAVLPFPNGYFTGGFVEWTTDDGGADSRMIQSQNGTALTLLSQPVGLKVGATLRVTAGCAHDPDTCQNKFANIKNYGGMPYIPSKNPYGNDPIY